MKILAAICVAISLSACGKWSDRNGHGLRTFDLEMKTEDVSDLWAGAEQHIKRPAKLKLDGQDYQVQVSVAGQSTIREPKKSLTITFEDKNWEGESEYRLATAIRDRSLLRSMLARDVFVAAGVPCPQMEPVFVYLNDNVLGLYIGTELVDQAFFARRGIPTTQWFEVKEDNSFVGRPKHNLDLIVLVHSLLGIADDTEFASRVLQLMDQDAIVHYLAAAQVINHWDGFNKNLFYVRSAPVGKLQVAAWDFDFTWPTEPRESNEPWNINELWSRLSRIPSVRAAFQAQVADLKNGAASLAAMQAKINERKEQIRAAYEADPFKGGLGFNLDFEAQNLYDIIATWYSRIP